MGQEALRRSEDFLGRVDWHELSVCVYPSNLHNKIDNLSSRFTRQMAAYQGHLVEEGREGDVD